MSDPRMTDTRTRFRFGDGTGDYLELYVTINNHIEIRVGDGVIASIPTGASNVVRLRFEDYDEQKKEIEQWTIEER